MPTAILAAIDFSPISDRVLALASELAEKTGASLVVLHAAAPDPDFVGYEVGPQYVRDDRAEAAEHYRIAQQASVANTQLTERVFRLQCRLRRLHDHVVNKMTHDTGEDVFLGVEVAVHRGGGHAGRLGQARHRHRLQALL